MGIPTAMKENAHVISSIYGLLPLLDTDQQVERDMIISLHFTPQPQFSLLPLPTSIVLFLVGDNDMI
jgi:hypothetical protein